MADLHYSAIYSLEVWYNQELSKTKRQFKNSSLNLLKSNPKAIDILMNSFKQIGELNALDSELIYLIDESKQYKI